MKQQNGEPKGCLAAILSLFGIKLGTRVNQAVDQEAGQAAAFPFRLRDDFLSPAELSFYRVLANAVGDGAVVCTKVNLNDIFFVARPNENQAYRNKIDRKHVDFLLCDPATMKPQAGVELDDSSHRRADRQARDEFVDQVFQVSGLPLVRVPAQASYHVSSLAVELAPYLEGRRVTQPSIPATTTAVARNSGPPTCPKCGVPMVQRTASKGANKGRQFWGCQNFPMCREVIS